MLKAYAVFDAKAESFGNPLFCSTDGLALRGFSDACSNPEAPMCKFPEDYVLFRIGSYDPNTGKFTDVTPAVHVVSASAVVEQLKAARAPSLPEGVKRVA